MSVVHPLSLCSNHYLFYYIFEIHREYNITYNNNRVYCHNNISYKAKFVGDTKTFEICFNASICFSQLNSILDIWVTLYSDQPFKPNVPVQQKQKEPDFIFYFIILYKCTLQPAACMENGLKGLKGCCHWELKCRILLCSIFQIRITPKIQLIWILLSIMSCRCSSIKIINRSSWGWLRPTLYLEV